MGLSKTTLSFLIGSSFFLGSCTHTTTSMSASDEKLFETTLKNSSLSYNTAHSEGNLSLYTVIPRDLKEALTSYQDMYKFGGIHDYDYLQELGIRFLESSKEEYDPEAQLLSVYGASIAKNHKLLPLLEQALQSPHPQVQLAAIRALSEYYDDEADRILIKGMRSNYLEVCFETVFTLCIKKHPHALGYIDGLMNRVPTQFHFLFPTLYALLDTPQSAKSLKKMFQHPDAQVRIEAVLSSAKLNRKDLLPQIRMLSKQHDISQQEACAFALASFQDESSIPILEELAQSPSEHVAIAALEALYKLGRRDVVPQLEDIASRGNIFAIHALRNCQGDEKLLEVLSYHSNDQVRLNASLALLKKKNPLCLPEIRSILIPKDDQLLILPSQSPGKALSAKKWTLNNSKAFRENPYLSEFSSQIKREILMECLELPENVFLSLAAEIVDAHQNDLIPQVIELVESLKTNQAVALLKEWQRKVGNPYVRAWSNLALFNLDEEGPWKQNIITWIKKQKYHPLIRLRPIVPWNRKRADNPFDLSPEEKSQLLIQSYIAIALRQEESGLDIILSHLSNQNSKNKYALAGILIKATE